MEERRVILIVLDSLGVGELPDAAEYGDEGAHTLNHIAEKLPDLDVPNLKKLGFGEIEGVRLPGGPAEVTGCYGKAMERSHCKDTIAGHWEIAGIITEIPFRTFTDTGFPESFIQAFEERIGTPVLGNYAASGVEILKELGPEQRRTGYPIVYTSADSVFQIAADVDVIPLERLYEICGIAREMLQGDLLVGRVIARPYTYADGVYTRTADRKDYALEPPETTILDAISASGRRVCAVGKIEDVFKGRGITDSIHTKNNEDGVDRTLEFMDRAGAGLIFTNLVEFDSLYGHRRDPIGYGRAIEAFDRRLPELLAALREQDMLIITADHGNDPVHSGWNHTREHIPILLTGPALRRNISLGTRSGFADIGATICDYLGVEWHGNGISFLDEII